MEDKSESTEGNSSVGLNLTDHVPEAGKSGDAQCDGQGEGDPRPGPRGTTDKPLAGKRPPTLPPAQQARPPFPSGPPQVRPCPLRPQVFLIVPQCEEWKGPWVTQSHLPTLQMLK